MKCLTFIKMDPLLHDFKVLCKPLYCVDNSSLANIVFKISFCTVHCAGLCGFFFLLTVLFWQRAPPEAGVLPGSSHPPGHPQKIQVVQVW